jgi:Flp pilus assembly protein TadG
VEIFVQGVAKVICSKLRSGLSKSESGSAAIEFAMVGAPFFFLLGCIIEIGLMIFVEGSIQAAVTKASRDLRTGQAQNANVTAAQFKSKVCELAGIVVDCGKITVYVDAAANGSFATLRANLPSFVDVGPKPDGTPNATAFNCGAPSIPVGIVASYDWKFAFPFLAPLENVDSASGSTRRLYGIAIGRNEPYPPTGTCS